jgi:ATP-dependent helicase HrpA
VLQSPSSTIHRAGERFTAWTFEAVPELLELQGMGPRGDETLVGYPALVDRSDAVELQVFDEPEVAAREHRAGLRRLFALALREPIRFFERNIPDLQRLSMAYAPFGSTDDLKRDLVAALLERACLAQPLPADSQAFEARVAEARARVTLVGSEVARTLSAILTEHAAVVRKLAASKSFTQAHTDMTQQLAAMLGPRFVVELDSARFGHLQRYLKACTARLDKLRADPARDTQRMAELMPLLTHFNRARAALKGRYDPRLEEFRWLLEELRVSLFAQELRTPMPVSVKRLQKVWESIR